MKKNTDYQELGGWKYRIIQPLIIETDIIPPKPIKTNFSALYMNGKLSIEKGFCWDGASGGFDTANFMRASLIHDCFCNWMVQDLLPYNPYWDKADALLRKIALEDGMSKFRANYVYQAIKYHGCLRYGVR